jgi:hypothetical protein
MMNYLKPEIRFTGSALAVVTRQTLSTKGNFSIVDILPPDVGVVDQSVTPMAYEADE